MKSLYIVLMVKGSSIATYCGLHSELPTAISAAMLEFPGYEYYDGNKIKESMVLDAAKEITK